MLYSEHTPSGTRAEQFLRRYRVLEGLLEKAMASKKPSSSFVMDYLHDDDSMPIRYELNMCREIRNLLTHNSDPSGQAVVEPSEAVLSALERVILHVSTPRSAISYGTPAEKIMTASTIDNIEDVMHHMAKLGYSNVPIMDHGHMVGVFGKSSLFAYAERFGFESLNDRSRMCDIREATSLREASASRYAFMPEKTTIQQARAVFNEHNEKNKRLNAIFITTDGTSSGRLLAMLTPWDVLKHSVSRED